MNIAIFGGSFDPVHIGHEKIVYKVLDNLDISTLYVVPTYLNPFKNSFMFSPTTRYDLLTKLFDNKKIKISNFEIKANKPVYTIDTVMHFKNLLNPKTIYLIIGQDNLAMLKQWKDFEKLNSLVEFVVITRDDKKQKDDIMAFRKIDMDIKVSSSNIRAKQTLENIPKKIQNEVKKLWKIE